METCRLSQFLLEQSIERGSADIPRPHSETSRSFVGSNVADKRAKIIELNDQLRATFKGGRVQMTYSVYALDAQLRGRALYVMSRYNKFDDGSEHDYGVFIFAGYAFEWCIEYCTKDGTGVSPDPADPDKTFRVLTLYALDDKLRLAPMIPTLNML